MSESRLERGRRIRRQVLGADELVPASSLMEPYREAGLEFAWGTIWAREGLTIKTRRFLTLALLAAQNRPRELDMHIRAALADGCTREEIREVFLHVICYCGFPTAADALKILNEVKT